MTLVTHRGASLMQDRFHEYVKWTWQLLGELETYHEDIGHIQEFLLAEGERVEGHG